MGGFRRDGGLVIKLGIAAAWETGQRHGKRTGSGVRHNWCFGKGKGKRTRRSGEDPIAFGGGGKVGEGGGEGA